MKYRRFGDTDLHVSEIGFGAWAIGGNAMVGDTAIGWGKSDDVVSKAAIHKSLDCGINFFDTADIYGLGHSEKLLGESLRSEKNVIIASKVGNVARDGQFTTDYTRNYILKACEDSLRRLQRDTIALYQLHSARVNHLQAGECVEAMELLQQQGKIRYWGISLNTFEPFPEAEYLIQRNLGSSFQVVFNLINQLSLPLIQLAQQNGYGTIVRMPLQFGLLTGKFTKNTSFEKDDHRHKRLTPEIIERVNNILEEKVWRLCDKYNVSKTTLALSFILSFAEVSTVIPGIRTPEHAVSNTEVPAKLEATDMTYLRNLYTTDFADVMKLIKQQG